jgi:hypothetical protein
MAMRILLFTMKPILKIVVTNSRSTEPLFFNREIPNLLEDHLFLKDVDVLFFSPTEHNMYIDRSVILINTLEPKYIFPQHHSTIIPSTENRFWAKGYPHEVKLRLSKPLQEKYHILKPGDMMKLKW